MSPADLLRRLDALLRTSAARPTQTAISSGSDPEVRMQAATSHPDPLALALAIGLGGLAYGMVMGSYSDRLTQSLYSGLKVPMLLCVATGVCLPNFYVLHAVLGLQKDFTKALDAVIRAQAVLSLTLLSLAPLTWFAYTSSISYTVALMWNGLQFLLATVAGQLTLQARYRVLEQENPRHRVTRRTWGVLYSFVAVQTAWVIRPFIGDPTLPSQFLRAESWDNAYVRVAETIWRLLTGG